MDSIGASIDSLFPYILIPDKAAFARRLRIRPLALTHKNALFAGSDGGGEHWATIASLVETCKLNGVDPQAWFADVLTKLAGGHPITKLDELLPWAYARRTEPAVA